MDLRPGHGKPQRTAHNVRVHAQIHVLSVGPSSTTEEQQVHSGTLSHTGHADARRRVRFKLYNVREIAPMVSHNASNVQNVDMQMDNESHRLSAEHEGCDA